MARIDRARVQDLKQTITRTNHSFLIGGSDTFFKVSSAGREHDVRVSTSFESTSVINENKP